MDAMPAITFIANDTAGLSMTSSRAAYEFLRLPRASNSSLSAPAEQRPSNFRALKNGRQLMPEELPVQLAAATGQKIEDYELTLEFEDGSQHTISGNAAPLLDESGRPRGAVGSFIDITERKKMQEALQESQERLLLFIETAPASLAMFDSKMHYLSASKRWLADYSLGNRNLQGLSHYEVFPEISNEWKEAHLRGLAGEVLRAEAERFERADGSVQWVRWEIHPWRNAAGEVGGIVIFTEDVTELKKAEAELRQQREWLHVTLSSIGDAVISTDTTGRITFMNATAEALTGWPFHEASNRPVGEVFNIINEFTRQAAESPVTMVLNDVVIVCPINHTILVTRDGAEVPIEPSGSPIKDAEGRTLGIVLVFRDITERKRAESENKRLLNSVQEEKDRLLALVNSVSDEIWFADTQKRFTLANPSALHEFSLDSSTNIDVWKFTESLVVYRPDGSPRPVEEAPPLRALGGEAVKNQEEIVKTPGSGELRYRQVSANPVKNPKGHVIGSVAIVHDITERKRMEEALIENKKQFELALRSAGMGAWHLDISPYKLHYDEQVCHLLGINPSTFNGTREEFIEAIHPDDRDMIREVHSRTIAQGEMYSIEYRVLWPDGSIHYISSRGKLVRDDVDRPMRLNGIIWDVTERKKADENLQEITERLHLATASAKAGVWDWNLQTSEMIWDDRMLELYGLTRENFPGGIEAWERGLTLMILPGQSRNARPP